METAYVVYLWTYISLVIILIIYFFVTILSWAKYWKKMPYWKRKKLKDESW